MGEGAMTGRRMGKCTNFGAKSKNAAQPNVVPESENPQNTVAFDESAGMGLGRGRRGMGRGPGRGQNGNGMGMGRRHRNHSGNGNN